MNREKILIIEDDKAFALMLTSNLKVWYSVKSAHSYSEAMEVLKDYDPDFVILDYYLPDKTGGEIFKEFQKALPGTRVVILSANNSGKTVLDLIRLGVKDYVMKGENSVEEIRRILTD